MRKSQTTTQPLRSTPANIRPPQLRSQRRRRAAHPPISKKVAAASTSRQSRSIARSGEGKPSANGAQQMSSKARSSFLMTPSSGWHPISWSEPSIRFRRVTRQHPPTADPHLVRRDHAPAASSIPDRNNHHTSAEALERHAHLAPSEPTTCAANPRLICQWKTPRREALAEPLGELIRDLFVQLPDVL